MCYLSHVWKTLKSFLTIALKTKFLPGEGIFLACRSVPNNFLRDLGLTFLPTEVVAYEGGGKIG